MHWHGLYQNGTSNMDGPTGVVQCEIPPGHTMKYDFIVSTYDISIPGWLC